jgi:Protein of unknown function (DUF2478)
MMTHPALGVLQTQKNDGSEKLLSDFAHNLIQNGWNVGGLVQHTSRYPSGSNLMELVDIRTQERFVISQPLAAASQNCCLDPGGLCTSSAVLRREIEAGADLLIINKFAVAEAEGKGLLQELFMAIEREIPILTSVSNRYKDDWDRLTGGYGEPIAPTAQAIQAWWDRLHPPV